MNHGIAFQTFFVAIVEHLSVKSIGVHAKVADGAGAVGNGSVEFGPGGGEFCGARVAGG